MSIFVTQPIALYLRTKYLNLSDQTRVIDIHNTEGLKLITKMCLRVSHLADHKLRRFLTHSFSMPPLSTLWEHQKIFQFSIVFRGTERVHWERMG